jgi:hypothetical protein
VFCDNSNTYLKDFDYLKDLAKRFWKRLEFLIFQWDITLTEKYWYWCGEAEIFDYFFEHSILLKGTESFYKLSGRYILRNVNMVIDKLKNKKDYFRRAMFCTNIFELNNYFMVATAFFKISKEKYEEHLYKKQLSLCISSGIRSEIVWYILLRTFLLQTKRPRITISFDYPRPSIRRYIPDWFRCFYQKFFTRFWTTQYLIDWLFYHRHSQKTLK